MNFVLIRFPKPARFLSAPVSDAAYTIRTAATDEPAAAAAAKPTAAGSESTTKTVQCSSATEQQSTESGRRLLSVLPDVLSDDAGHAAVGAELSRKRSEFAERKCSTAACTEQHDEQELVSWLRGPAHNRCYHRHTGHRHARL